MTRFIFMMLAMASIPSIMAFATKKPKYFRFSNRKVCIYYSRFIMLIGVFSSSIINMIFLILYFWSKNKIHITVLAITIGISSAIGIILSIYSIRTKIIVDDSNIIFTPAFGRTKQYKIDSIDYVIRECSKLKNDQTESLIIYQDNKKIIWLNNVMIGYQDFINWLEKMNIKIRKRN